MNIKTGSLIVLIFIIGALGFFIGKASVKPAEDKYFTKNSAKYLNEIRLDLPEEISTITDEQDSTVDLLTGYLDTKEGTIYIGFTGMQMFKNDWQYVNEDPCKIQPFTPLFNNGDMSKDLHEYQLDLEMDSVTLYDHGRFVGTVKYGNSPLDSLFMVDNQ